MYGWGRDHIFGPKLLFIVCLLRYATHNFFIEVRQKYSIPNPMVADRGD